jgi:hypothetical protein
LFVNESDRKAGKYSVKGVKNLPLPLLAKEGILNATEWF